MSITIRDLQKKQADKLSEKANKVKRFPAKLTKVANSVRVNNQPNKVYFQEFNSSESAIGIALNTRVPFVAGLAVIVEEVSEQTFEIVDLYKDDTNPSETQNIGAFSLPGHHENHEYQSESDFGVDVVRTFLPAIQPFKTTFTSATLNYTVQPFPYVYKQAPRLFPGYSGTLTASTAGKIRYVAIGLDLQTNTIVEIEGDEVIDNSIIPVPSPDLITNFLLSCFLATDDTSIVDVIDYRGIVNFSDSNLTPRAENDILIATTAYEFESQRPIVDVWGEIITDSDGAIVTV